MNNENIREEIVNATIRCIGKYGIQSVTNRLIAKEADVNSAAINYYFGAKENLVNEAIKSSLDNYFSEYLEPSDEKYTEHSIKQILERFLTDTLRDSIANPFFIKSYLFETFTNDNYNSIFINQFNSFLKQLYDGADIDAMGNIDEFKISVLQIMSSLMFLCLMPDFFKDSINIDLKEPDNQKALVDSILKKIG